MKDVAVLLDRHIGEYCTGGKLSQPSGDLLDQAKYAPAHNIFGERAFVTADSAIRRLNLKNVMSVFT